MAPICLTSHVTCAVEEQLTATSPKASDAPTSSAPEPLAAHVTGSTPIDAQQQLPQDLINDLAASEAVMQDGFATAVGSLTGSASKAQQAAASSYSMDADIGDVSPPSSIPDGGMLEGADLSDAAAQDLAAAAEEAAHAATPSTDGGIIEGADLSDAASEDLAAAAEEAAHAATPSAADESPDVSRTAESAPQEFLTSDPADSGPVSPPSSRPDGADFSPSDDGLSDAAAEDLAAAAEEAAHSAADESSDAEVSGTRVSALQRFLLSTIPNGNCLLEDDKTDAAAEDLAAAAEEAAHSAADESSDAEISSTRVSALQRFLLSTIPNGNRLPQDHKSDAAAEDLAAAADAAAGTSASSSELQTDADPYALSSGTEQSIAAVSADSSSSSVSPPLELQTSIVSDLSEIQLLRSQVCILPVSLYTCVCVWVYVCLSVCPPGTAQLLSHKHFHVRHVICHRMAHCVMSVNE